MPQRNLATQFPEKFVEHAGEIQASRNKMYSVRVIGQLVFTELSSTCRNFRGTDQYDPDALMKAQKFDEIGPLDLTRLNLFYTNWGIFHGVRAGEERWEHQKFRPEDNTVIPLGTRIFLAQ